MLNYFCNTLSLKEKEYFTWGFYKINYQLFGDYSYGIIWLFTYFFSNHTFIFHFSYPSNTSSSLMDLFSISWLFFYLLEPWKLRGLMLFPAIKTIFNSKIQYLLWYHADKLYTVVTPRTESACGVKYLQSYADFYPWKQILTSFYGLSVTSDVCFLELSIKFWSHWTQSVVS